MRFVVRDRKVTRGSRSEGGQRWLERMSTTIETCSVHGKSLLDILRRFLEHFVRVERRPPLVQVGCLNVLAEL